MSSTSITLELSPTILEFVQGQALEHGLTAEAWLLRQLEMQRKIHEQNTAFFEERRKRARSGAFEELLARVPDVPPMPGDELPEPHRV